MDLQLFLGWGLALELAKATCFLKLCHFIVEIHHGVLGRTIRSCIRSIRPCLPPTPPASQADNKKLRRRTEDIGVGPPFQSTSDFCFCIHGHHGYPRSQPPSGIAQWPASQHYRPGRQALQSSPNWPHIHQDTRPYLFIYMETDIQENIMP